MFKRTFQIAALSAIVALLGAASPPSAPAPVIFAPGIISGPANDGAPSFLPDGKTLFFTRSGTSEGAIMESHREGDTWSAPQLAPFSGEWNDQHAAVAPDGSYLVYVSVRPVSGPGKRAAHLWRINRTSDGWGTPFELPNAVNIGPRIFKPSVAADGTIYFLSIGPKRTFVLYRSAYVSGSYRQAERLPFSTEATADVDPEIAPDQSFLVFASSGRRGKDDTKEHLYIVFNHRGTWGDVMPLRYAGDDDNGSSNDNEPDLAPDGRTLYFSSDRVVPTTVPRSRERAIADLKRIDEWNNGNANVWTLSLAPWLDREEHAP